MDQGAMDQSFRKKNLYGYNKFMYIRIHISVTIRRYNNLDRDNAPIDKEISIRKVRQIFDNGFNVPYLIKHEPPLQINHS